MGDPARFQQQTGQKSAIKHVFLGWQQGMAWGKKLDVYLPQLTPIPMLHLGTGGPRAPRRAVITPQQIARGAGDACLVYLNKAINGFGSLVYVRPMAEMEQPERPVSPLEGRAARPEWYRLMFARIFLILHGGPRVKIDVALNRLGLPFLVVKEDLPANNKAKLRVIWNPVAGVGGWMGFYPGKKYVDLVGNDMYGEGADFSRAANKQLYAFARAQSGTPSPSGACRSTSPSSCATSATSSRRSRRSSSRPTSTASPARSGTSARSRTASRPVASAARAGRLGRRDRLQAERALDGALRLRARDVAAAGSPSRKRIIVGMDMTP